MQASLKKSLYLGLAALGFVAVAGATNATTANAAAAKEVSKTTIEHMNVAVTGSNAMYTRPGTLKGAKMVASTTTLKKLAKSTSGEDNWMAYQTVTTDRGSIYYKVVSFDKAYRGYVYAGSVKENPKGGLTAYSTFKEDEKPTMTGNYTIKTPGTTNDGMSLTYKDASWTVMGSGRVIKDSTPYAKDVLRVTKTGVSQRDGFKWAYVEDDANPSINGWIRQEGLKETTEIPASQGITLKYVDNNGKDLGSKVIAFPGKDTDKTADVTTQAMDPNNVPAGYEYAVASSNVTAAAKGDTVTVTVKQNALTKEINAKMMVAANDDGTFPDGFSASTSFLDDGYLTADQKKAYNDLKVMTEYQTISGTPLDASKVEALMKAAKLDKFDFTAKNGKTYTATLKSVSNLNTVKDQTTVSPNVMYTVVEKVTA